MALQTLASSVTSNPPGATSSPPPNPDANNDEGNINGHNSIPFSFLVAFLVLFVCFMVLGLWARRFNYWVRRRLGLPIPEPRPRKSDFKLRKPDIWDVYPENLDGAKTQGVARWNGIQPLASWYRRERLPTDSDDTDPTNRYRDPITGIPLDAPESLVYVGPPSRGGFGRRAARLVAPPTPTPPQRHSHEHEPSYLRELLTYLHFPGLRRKAEAAEAEAAKRRKKAKVEALQVAVFVAMPSEEAGTRSKRNSSASSSSGSSMDNEKEKEKEKRRDGDVGGGIAIGIAEVPWEGDVPSSLGNTDS